MGPAGETLLEYSAHDAMRAGFGRVVLVVRAETEQEFRRRLGPGMARRLSVAYAHQRLDQPPAAVAAAGKRERPWGTGHAVLAAAPQLAAPFAAINADDFYGAAALARVGGFLSTPPEPGHHAAIGFRLADTLSATGPVSRAVLEADEDGRLRDAVEYGEVWRERGEIVGRTDAGQERSFTGEELVSMNLWGFAPDLPPALGDLFARFLHRSAGDPGAEFRLPEAVRGLVAAGRCRVDVLPGGGDWCGLTFRGDRDRVRQRIAGWIAEGRYPRDLWAEPCAPRGAAGD